MISRNLKPGFLDRGYDRTTLLLPGWATDRRVFGALDIGSNYLQPPATLPLSGLCDAVLAAMEEHGLARISVFGWSMGATIACDLLPRLQERIDELVLVGLRPGYSPDDMNKIKVFLRRNKEAYLRKFYADCFAGDGWAWFGSNLLDDYLRSMDLGILTEGLDYLARSRVTAQALRGVRVRFVHGRLDRIAPAEELAALKAGLPEAGLIMIEGAGHASFLDGRFNGGFRL